MAPGTEELDLDDPDFEREPADEEPGWFGPDLDYRYDPGAGGDWMAS
jgi:hypothetical protein